MSLSTDTNEAVCLFVKISDKAFTPTRSSSFAAGYDLYSASTMVIEPQGKAVIPTDLKIAVPNGTYGRIAPRSGLAVKNFIDVGAGVIDEDYRGPVNIVLFNHGKTWFEVKQGDRVAQLIFERIVHPVLQEVNNLEMTKRNENGFGSTGIN